MSENVTTINRELVVSADASAVNIVLLEDKKLVEYRKEQNNTLFAVGDVYLGVVRKILPGLNAAFVDVGHKKHAFMHYLDLGLQISSLKKFMQLAREGKTAQLNLEQFKMDTNVGKNGKIADFLAVGDQIPVQIAKEPIATKGPRLTMELSFAGRYLVLTPFSNKVSVSQKIKSKAERNRLRDLINSIRPRNFGIIIRTVAEERTVDELDADLKDLLSKWEKIVKGIRMNSAPSRIVGELDRVSVTLRDMLNESFNGIYVNSKSIYEEVKNYIATIAPQKVGIVKLYEGGQPIFERFGVSKQIKGMFGRIVTIRNGVYLIIEHTEAMHVIDVNSGHRVNKENSQEENALEVNLEAATEIARQLRLRDMGGIIIVDFIDLHEPKNRKLLFDKLQEEMAKDKAKHTILPPSKFGLIQITRHRVRPETEVRVQEKCPSCNGTGTIRPSSLFIEEVEDDLRYLLVDQDKDDITLQVHPFLYAYLTKGLFSIKRHWKRKYKKKIDIQAVNSFYILQYNFLNKDGMDIQL